MCILLARVDIVRARALRGTYHVTTAGDARLDILYVYQVLVEPLLRPNSTASTKGIHKDKQGSQGEQQPEKDKEPHDILEHVITAAQRLHNDRGAFRNDQESQQPSSSKRLKDGVWTSAEIEHCKEVNPVRCHRYEVDDIGQAGQKALVGHFEEIDIRVCVCCSCCC